MTKITKLTKEQEQYLPVYFKEELARGCSVVTPPDDEIRNLINEIYTHHEFKVPSVIICDSPLTSQLCLNLIQENKLGDLLVGSLGDALRASLRGSLGGSLGDSQLTYRATWFWGQFDNYWIAFYKFCQFIGVQYHPEAQYKLDLMQRLANSASFVYFYENVCVVSRKPVFIGLNDQNILHCDHRAAMEFADGYKIYAIRGRRVPDFFIEDKSKITPEYIDKEENAELRQIALHQYGIGNYFEAKGAKIEAQDSYGTLMSYTDKVLGMVKAVKVKNCSPEPDGTYKDCVLRVPPTVTTARGAVAATFGLAEHEYSPYIET